MAARLEYIGFTARSAAREYTLRLTQAAGAGHHEFTLVIANEAFLSQRVRYQDAPEICYIKLQRALVALDGGLPALRMDVTDSELEDYRVSHAPKSDPRGHRSWSASTKTKEA